MYRLNDMREARRQIPATSIRLLNTLTNTARKIYTNEKKKGRGKCGKEDYLQLVYRNSWVTLTELGQQIDSSANKSASRETRL